MFLLLTSATAVWMSVTCGRNSCKQPNKCARHLNADVVDASLLVFLQETRYRTFLPQRMEQLKLGVIQLYEHRGHSVLRQGLHHVTKGVERLQEIATSIRKQKLTHNFFEEDAAEQLK